jgi:hypothetical protein
MAQSKESTDGVVYRSQDGTMYFIRNEILDLCKVEPEFEADTEKMLGGKGKGQGGGKGQEFVQPVRIDANDSGFEHSANVKPRVFETGIESRALVAGGQVGSTIMCCW